MLKVFQIVMGSLATLSLLSTLICGLWMRSQPSVDPSSITFHLQIAVASVVLTLITFGLLFFFK